jgi:hypothetical protein
MSIISLGEIKYLILVNSKELSRRTRIFCAIDSKICNNIYIRIMFTLFLLFKIINNRRQSFKSWHFCLFISAHGGMLDHLWYIGAIGIR